MPYSKTMQALQNKVKLVQQKVGVTLDGDYGSATTAAVKRYQSTHGLGTTGLAGYWTMLSMGIPRVISGSTANMIVLLAQSQRGVHEWGNNCNPYGPCEAWCADFAKWVWKQAGVNVSGITATARSFYEYGKKHNTVHSGSKRLNNPKLGDAIYYLGSQHKYGHVGLIIRVFPDGRVYTVEGNSSNQVKLVGPFFPGSTDAHAIVTP